MKGANLVRHLNAVRTTPIRLECQNRAQRNYRARHPEKFRALTIKHYYANREKILWERAKTRAKKKDIPFNLELSDISIPEYCPILGLRLATGPSGRKWGSDNSPSIDRIDPDLGYVKGNIQIISWRANTLKKNATLEELRLIYEFMLKKEGSF